jgi:hypothetical protein
MKKEGISLSDKCLVRIPLFPVRFLEEYVGENSVDLEGIIGLDKFKEAIYFASDSVYESISKNHVDAKLMKTILKYFSRACSRSTPYGLFGGVGVAKFGEGRTCISLSDQRCDISLDAVFKEELKKKSLGKKYKNLTFLLNPSLHKQYDQYQYLVKCESDDVKDFEIRTTEETEFLLRVIEICSSAKPFLQLLSELELSFDGYEVEEFLVQLIQEQILLPVENEEMFIEYCWGDNAALACFVDGIDVQIEELRSKIGHVDSSISLCAHMTFDLGGSTVGQELKSNLLSIVDLCSSDDRQWSSILNLKTFRDNFLRKYEGREVSLLEVFDVDNYPFKPYIMELPMLGIPFLEDFVEIVNRKSVTGGAADMGSEVLVSKFDTYEIQKEEVNVLKHSKIPPTFSALVELFRDNTFYLKEIGGGSAMPLIGRYKQLLPEVKELIGEISFFEENKTNHIIAEVDFTPFIKAENIVPASTSYSHTIQIHESRGNDARNIPLSDLVVGVDEEGKVYLKSMSLGRIVIPRMSNVLNYSRSLLSIYKFLGDLQYQYSTIILDTRFTHDGKSAVFLPRVTYKGNIIQARQWLMNRKVMGKVSRFEEFVEKLENFVMQYKVESMVYMVSGDQEFLVNLQNQLFQEILWDYYKRSEEIKFRERFSDKELLVRDHKNEQYVNEVVFSFRNQNAGYE